jgi:hypothetical protein
MKKPTSAVTAPNRAPRPWASVEQSEIHEETAVHTFEWSSVDIAPEPQWAAFVVAHDTFDPQTTVATCSEPGIWFYLDQDHSDLVEFNSVAGVRALAASLLVVADRADELLALTTSVSA